MIYAIASALLHSLWQAAAIAAVCGLTSRYLLVTAKARANCYLVGLLATLTVAVVTFATAEPTPRTTALIELAGPTLIWSWLAPWLVAAWSGGVSLAASRHAVGLWQTTRLRRRSTPVVGVWARRLDEMALDLGLRARVQLRESVDVVAPAIVGWLSPYLLVPIGFLPAFARAEIEAIFAHELAHVRRHDYLVNLVQISIETLFFYHPAVRYLGARLNDEREFGCDDLAVAAGSDPLTFARALTRLEGLRAAAPVAGVYATGGNLMQRIERIVDPARAGSSPTRPWSFGAMLLVTAVAGLSLAAACDTAESTDEADIVERSADVDGEHVWVSADGDHEVHVEHAGEGKIIEVHADALPDDVKDMLAKLKTGEAVPADLEAALGELHPPHGEQPHALFVVKDDAQPTAAEGADDGKPKTITVHAGHDADSTWVDVNGERHVVKGDAEFKAGDGSHVVVLHKEHDGDE